MSIFIVFFYLLLHQSLIFTNDRLFYRIRQEKNGGAWCPKAQISSEVREYLEIDLDENHLVTWTETQGRWGNGQGQEFTEAFTVEYWRKSIGRWVEYKDSRDNKASEIIIFFLFLIEKKNKCKYPRPRTLHDLCTGPFRLEFKNSG